MQFSILSTFVAMGISACVDASRISSATVPAATASNVSITVPAVVSTSTAFTYSVPSSSAVYPACIVLVNGTGSVVPWNATATTFNSVSLATAADNATFTFNASNATIYPSPTTFIAANTTFFASATATFNASNATTVFATATANSTIFFNATTTADSSNATVSCAPTTAAVNASITSFFGTVYTTAPGQVTTVFASGFPATIPSSLPLCSSLTPPLNSSVSANSTQAGNGTSLSDTNNNTKSGVATNAAGLSTVVFGICVAFAAFCL